VVSAVAYDEDNERVLGLRLKSLLSRPTKRGDSDSSGALAHPEPSRISGAILLSKTDVTARRDFLDLPDGAVVHLCTTLSGGADTIELGELTNFFALLARAKSWDDITAVIVGRSLEKKFDRCVLDSLAAAASRSAGRSLDVYRQSSSGNAPLVKIAESVSPESLTLGNWLSCEAMASSEHDPNKKYVSVKDLEYLIGSGGYRAGALIATLRKNYAGREFRDVIDLGAGIGFISCLVALQREFGVRRTVLVEPQSVRVAQGERLWTSSGKRPTEDFEFVQQTTQKFIFQNPADLAIVCQSLFHVPAEELPAVIERTWNGLRPGGLLVINEHLTDELSEVKARKFSDPILQRERLIALLAAHAPPCVYQRRDRWTCARDPTEITAAELFSDSFLVVEKRQ
jgi:SAM-dependent methyltransferase